MSVSVEFFFDLSSPWTCLAFTNIQPILAETGATMRWRPFLVGGVFNAVNPRVYEKKLLPPLPIFPDVHPLVDDAYKPYDIGQVGALDVRILTTLMGGKGAARALTPAWNGGIYWAGQLRSANTAAAQANTASVALFYLSVWKNAGSASYFAKLYANSLDRKYGRFRIPDVSQGV